MQSKPDKSIPCTPKPTIETASSETSFLLRRKDAEDRLLWITEHLLWIVLKHSKLFIATEAGRCSEREGARRVVSLFVVISERCLAQDRPLRRKKS